MTLFTKCFFFSARLLSYTTLTFFAIRNVMVILHRKSCIDRSTYIFPHHAYNLFYQTIFAAMLCHPLVLLVTARILRQTPTSFHLRFKISHPFRKVFFRRKRLIRRLHDISHDIFRGDDTDEISPVHIHYGENVQPTTHSEKHPNNNR